MCKETDETGGGTEKGKVMAGLPEPGTPVPIPKDSIIPPIHETYLDRTATTPAHEEKFDDRDFSSISDRPAVAE